MSIVLTAIAFVFSLILSAFFSCAEAACSGLSRPKVRQLTQRHRQFSLLLDIMANPQRLAVGLFVGQRLFGGAAVVTATVLAQQLFISLVPNYLWAIMLSVIFVISLWMVLISDMLPKVLASRHPERLALVLGRFILFSIWILWPFIAVFEWIMRHVTHFSGYVFLDSSKFITAEEIKYLVHVGEQEGIIESVEKEMIHSIFDFSQTIVREIMTPRTDVVAVKLDISVAEAIATVKENGHSRIPVYEDKIDNIIGILYAKDLLDMTDLKAGINTILRDPMFVPETQNIVDLLHQMKRNKFHMAIVVDEYGGISGLVTMEDIIEEIIGEIQDEYDRDQVPEFTQVSEGHYIVDAGMNIDDLAERAGIVLPKDQDFDTIGGFVLSEMGKFPAKGDEVEYKGYTLTVLDVRKRRILSVSIVRKDVPEELG
jgi:putative hemolysin